MFDIKKIFKFNHKDVPTQDNTRKSNLYTEEQGQSLEERVNYFYQHLVSDKTRRIMNIDNDIVYLDNKFAEFNPRSDATEEELTQCVEELWRISNLINQINKIELDEKDAKNLSEIVDILMAKDSSLSDVQKECMEEMINVRASMKAGFSTLTGGLLLLDTYAMCHFHTYIYDNMKKDMKQVLKSMTSTTPT